VNELMHIFSLRDEWWLYAVRAAVVYIVVLLLLRISGKRRIGKLTPFDVVLLLLIGGAGARAALGPDYSVTAAGIVIGVMLTLNTVVGIVTARSARFERVIEGRPQFLLRQGKVDYAALRRESVSANDLLVALRMHGCMKPSEADYAILETNGAITVKRRPVRDGTSKTRV
jgi:uncharacterized membrane protein YcaP (DUF421 family)